MLELPSSISRQSWYFLFLANRCYGVKQLHKSRIYVYGKQTRLLLWSKLFIFQRLLMAAVKSTIWSRRQWRIRDVNKFIVEELSVSSSVAKNMFKKKHISEVLGSCLQTDFPSSCMATYIRILMCSPYWQWQTLHRCWCSTSTKQLLI